jgi:hypothetical protein
MKPIILLVVVLFVAGGVYYWWDSTQEPALVVASFEECVAAGNPVMESYPRQCRHEATGELFVEDIGEEINGTDAPTFTTEQGNSDVISVDAPQAGDTVASPLTVTGSARGMWYFEADFPVELVDSTGETLVMHYATAQSEWMTEDYVPFTSTLEFTVPAGITSGTLILHRDNPSGLPENDDRLEIPVTFAPQRGLEAEIDIDLEAL